MVGDLFSGPLFVIGNPRSGTSLLRLMLTCHRDIMIPPEGGFMIWLWEKYRSWSAQDSRDLDRRLKFVSDVCSSRKLDTWNISATALEAYIDSSQPSTYAALCESVYHLYGLSNAKNYRIWGDKNNFYLGHISDLAQLFPHAHFIHIVRDGRDVASSYREVMGPRYRSRYAPRLPTRVSEIALEWSANVLKAEDALAQLRPWQSKTLKYEDLVSSPEACAADICEWLGLSFDQGVLDFHRRNRSEELEPRETVAWKGRTLEPIDKSAVGKYAKVLTRAEQVEFDEIASPALEKFSYL